MDTETKTPAPVITTYVEYLFPGAFFSEESSEVVSERNPAEIAREANASVFAFRFYDIATTTAVVGGRQVELKSRAINETKRYYIDAEKLTAADVEALPGDHKILLANMRGNGWDVMLRCRTGNFQPMEDGDVVVSSETGRMDG